MVLLKNKFSLFSAALLLTVASVRATPDASLSVQSLLASADALLAAGDKHAALEHFDVAIKKDPTNYLTFFKRGATYLALGRSSKASEDFEAVLILKPGFEAALLQRAKLKAKLGDWDAARIDYIEAGAEKHVMYIQEIEEAAAAAKAAQAAEERQEWDTCVERAGSAILVANGVVYLRSLRARCRMEKGDVHEAVGDLTYVHKHMHFAAVNGLN
jgi:DnaJ family protein C protein 3